MKICPKCKRKWPDKGKFCPFDGTPLEEIKEDDKPSIQTSKTVIIESLKGVEVLPEAKTSSDKEDKSEEFVFKSKKRSPENIKRFSETQWFMKGINPEELEEVTPEDDIEFATEKYVKKEEIDEDVRKKFSLSNTVAKKIKQKNKKKDKNEN